MGRKNKKKNSGPKPSKTPNPSTQPSPSTVGIPPPPYTEHPTQPGPSTSSSAPPPQYKPNSDDLPDAPVTSRKYAIPTETEPKFKGILQERLEQSMQFFGRAGDIPIVVPTERIDIMYKLCYPAPGETSADYLFFKNELKTLFLQNKCKKNHKWLNVAHNKSSYLEDAGRDMEREHGRLYKGFRDTKFKKYILDVNKDAQKIYRDLTKQSLLGEVGELLFFFDNFPTIDDVEEECSNTFSMLDYFNEHPVLYLIREKFKTALLLCDHLGITVRTHSSILKELDRKYVWDKLPASEQHRLSGNVYIAGTEVLRNFGDTYISQVSKSVRMILVNLVAMMPRFLGTAVDEYFEFEPQANEWQKMKREFEEEIKQEGYVPVTNRVRMDEKELESCMEGISRAFKKIMNKTDSEDEGDDDSNDQPPSYSSSTETSNQ